MKIDYDPCSMILLSMYYQCVISVSQSSTWNGQWLCYRSITMAIFHSKDGLGGPNQCLGSPGASQRELFKGSNPKKLVG